MEATATERSSRTGGTPRKADLVADDLLRRIVRGEIATGTNLPRESELAERYGVNRSVVREAIKLLEVHRLVRPIRRRGTEVLDPLASLSPDVLRAMLQPEPGRIDRAILANLLEVRAHLDVEMNAVAAERRTDADVAAIEDAIASIRSSLATPRVYAERVNDLTVAIARATHNRVYEMLVAWHRMVHADTEEIFLAVRLASGQHAQGLELLLDAIRRRDVPTARALVTTYHEWATPRMLEAARALAGDPDIPSTATTETTEKRD